VKDTTRGLLARLRRLESACLPPPPGFWSAWLGAADPADLRDDDAEMWRDWEAVSAAPDDRPLGNHIDAALAAVEALPIAPLPVGLQELSPDHPYRVNGGHR
jgi:hypothetical protein